MNEADLRLIMPYAKKKIPTFLPLIDACFREFDISTPLRQAAFLAQIAHESGQLTYLEELASGAAYEGRKDLGNTHPGDGIKFKGRGLIQLTGRANYEACSKALGEDFIDDPELLALPVNAVRSAGWFWKTHGLNELADIPDFLKLTKRVNGGVNGYAQRLAYYVLAKQILGVQNATR